MSFERFGCLVSKRDGLLIDKLGFRAGAARRRPRGRRGRVPAPRRALPRRAARALLPDARLGPRRRGRPAGRAAARLARAGALRGPQLAALVALHDRHQHLPRPRSSGGPSACCRSTTGPPPTRTTGPASRSSSRSGSSPTPTSTLGARGRARRPRGPLRAARERRAGLRRRAPAPAGQPARRADPARGARLLGQGGRRDARDDRRLGQQRAAARPRRRSRSALPEQSQQATLRALGDERPARDRRRATSTRGSAATSTRSSRCSPRTPRSRCRRWRPGSAAARSIEIFLAGWPLSGQWRWRPVQVRANGQPALAFYSWDPDEEAYLPFALNVLTLPRRADQRRHGVHHPNSAGERRPRGHRADARAADQRCPARDRVPGLRPPRQTRRRIGAAHVPQHPHPLQLRAAGDRRGDPRGLAPVRPQDQRLHQALAGERGGVRARPSTR